MIVACTLLRHVLSDDLALVPQLIVALSAAVFFPLLVRACRRYMDHVPPTLPVPRSELQEVPVTAGT